MTPPVRVAPLAVDDLKAAVQQALDLFLKSELDLLSEDAGETTCAHHLANCLEKALFEGLRSEAGLRVDVEFSRLASEEAVVKYLPALVTRWEELRDMKGWEKGGVTGRVRPDIILHDRSRRDSNLLVIELKLSSNRSRLDRAWDQIKLEEFTKPREDRGLNYKLGAFIELGPLTPHFTLKWFAAGRPLEAPSANRVGMLSE